MALELNAVNLVLVAIAGLVAAVLGIRLGQRVNRARRGRAAAQATPPPRRSVVVRSVAGPGATAGAAGDADQASEPVAAETPIRAFSESELAWWLRRPPDPGPDDPVEDPGRAEPGRRPALLAAPPPVVSARRASATGAAGERRSLRDRPPLLRSRWILPRASAAAVLAAGLLLLVSSIPLPSWLGQGVLTATGRPSDGTVVPGESIDGGPSSPASPVVASGNPGASVEPGGSPGASAPVATGDSPSPWPSDGPGSTPGATPGPGATPTTGATPGPGSTPTPGATPTPGPGDTPTPTPATPTPAPTPPPTPAPTPPPTPAPTPAPTATTGPSAPQGLTASPAKGKGVQLAWSAPASDGGGPITEYRIWRDGTLLTTVSGIETSYKDTATTRGSTYSYEVSAFNGTFEGPRAGPVSAPAT